MRNTQGLLKRLLEPDDGYNMALSELTNAAEEAANKPEIKERATDKATREIERLVRLLIQSTGREVKVILKG